MSLINFDFKFSDKSDVHGNVPFYSSDLSSQKKLLIIINWKDWLNLQKYVSCRRRKFLSPFTKLLTLRLQKEGIKCCLNCNYNYFSTASVKKPLNFWRGTYGCNNPHCKANYVAIIKQLQLNTDVIIEVYTENECHHDHQEDVKIRIDGDYRKNLGKELLIKGTLMVKSENIIFNRDNVDAIHGKQKITLNIINQ